LNFYSFLWLVTILFLGASKCWQLCVIQIICENRPRWRWQKVCYHFDTTTDYDCTIGVKY